MTLVRIALDVPGPAGNVRATGRIRATPTRRRTGADVVVLPEPFEVVLVDGVTTVELAATGTDWCWKIEELTRAPATRYVVVPASVSELGYEDLTDVDPATLDPAVAPEAAWTLALLNLPGWVEVKTGDEPRPVTNAGVIWFDTRTDQSTAPTNMGLLDEWHTGTVADTTDPSVPTGLASSAITAGGFTVTWDAATDNVGVPGYVWRRNGGTATVVPASPRSLTFTGLDASTVHTVEVASRDAAGNVSEYASIEVTTDEAATETFTIYGSATPPGSWSLGTGEMPNITFGRGFYKFASSDPVDGLPTGRVVGAEVWLPEGETVPSEVTFYLFAPGADLESAPVQTKVLSLAGITAESWAGADFDAPTPLADDGVVQMIAARFTGVEDAGKYVFGTGVRPNADAVLSVSGKKFAWAEQTGPNAALSSQFRVGSGSAITPSEQTHSYGVQIRVDAGA